MKVYPVTEPELTSLADANTQTNVFGAAAATFAGSAVTLWAESTISAPASPAGELLLQFGPWLLLVVSAACTILWFFGLRRRRSIINTVRATAVEASIVPNA